MSKKVTHLSEHRPEPCRHAVDILEHALAQAKAGELRNVVVIGDWPGGDVYRAAGFDSIFELLGRIEVARETAFMGYRRPPDA